MNNLLGVWAVVEGVFIVLWSVFFEVVLADLAVRVVTLVYMV